MSVNETIPATPLTWEALVERLPTLESLLRDLVNEANQGREFCEIAFYPRLKQQVTALVGWESRAKDPVLRSPHAYAAVLQKCLNSLPRCRGKCACLYDGDDDEDDPVEPDGNGPGVGYRSDRWW
jgi:hypothetical protein